MAKSNLTRGIPSPQTYEITTVPPCSFTNFAKTEVVFLGHHLGFSRPGGTGPNICSEPDVLRGSLGVIAWFGLKKFGAESPFGEPGQEILGT